MPWTLSDTGPKTRLFFGFHPCQRVQTIPLDCHPMPLEHFDSGPGSLSLLQLTWQSQCKLLDVRFGTTCRQYSVPTLPIPFLIGFLLHPSKFLLTKITLRVFQVNSNTLFKVYKIAWYYVKLWGMVWVEWKECALSIGRQWYVRNPLLRGRHRWEFAFASFSGCITGRSGEISVPILAQDQTGVVLNHHYYVGGPRSSTWNQLNSFTFKFKRGGRFHR